VFRLVSKERHSLLTLVVLRDVKRKRTGPTWRIVSWLLIRGRRQRRNRVGKNETEKVKETEKGSEKRNRQK
jgi:hypothetical protein